MILRLDLLCQLVLGITTIHDQDSVLRCTECWRLILPEVSMVAQQSQGSMKSEGCIWLGVES